MNNIKMLWLSADKYPPSRVDVEVLFGEELTNKGYKIDWLLQSEKPRKLKTITTWKGGRVWVGANPAGEGFINSFLRHWYRIINELQLIKLVKQEKYDIIQAKDICLSALIACWVARRVDAKFFYWMSFPFPDAAIERVRVGDTKHSMLLRLKGYLFRWLVYRVLMKNADHVFVQSEQMKTDMIAEGVAENKLTSVPMGIVVNRLPEMEKINSNVQSVVSKKTVLYLGTMIRVRRLDFLIRVIAQVKMKFPDVILEFVGSSPHESDIHFLEEEMRKYNLTENICFTGQLPMKDAWAKVGSADVCVSPFFPSPILRSTSPTKLVEYMALGKAVVANNHPEQRLVIEQSGGGICVSWDETAFSEAICLLLDDEGKALLMGQKGKEYVFKERSYFVIAERLSNLYLKLLGRKIDSSKEIDTSHG